jgi:hypothetical protein
MILRACTINCSWRAAATGGLASGGRANAPFGCTAACSSSKAASFPSFDTYSVTTLSRSLRAELSASVALLKALWLATAASYVCCRLAINSSRRWM